MVYPTVALVVSSFPNRSETFVVSKFAGLLRRGWNVHVVCRTVNDDVWDSFSQLRPEWRRHVHATRPVRPQWLAAALFPVAAARSLSARFDLTSHYLRRGALRELFLDEPLIALRPDLVHFEFGALARDRAHLKRMLDCKLVASFRGYDVNFVGIEDDGYYDPLWREVDAVHLVSEAVWERVLQRGCPPRVRHATIPPGVDLQMFDPVRSNAAAAGALRIVSVGRLTWEKGYEYAMQAVRLLRDRGIRCTYTIVGDGAYVDALAFARHELGLDDVVRFAGGLSQAGVRDALAAADVMLHAAVSEGFCNAVLEAQAMQVPVVTTDAGGLPENVADGETGFVVSRRDPGAMTDRLQILADDPALRLRMGEAGRRRVVERFSADEHLSRFEDFYQCVLENRPVELTEAVVPT